MSAKRCASVPGRSRNTNGAPVPTFFSSKKKTKKTIGSRKRDSAPLHWKKSNRACCRLSPHLPCLAVSVFFLFFSLDDRPTQGQSGLLHWLPLLFRHVGGVPLGLSVPCLSIAPVSSRRLHGVKKKAHARRSQQCPYIVARPQKNMSLLFGQGDSFFFHFIPMGEGHKKRALHCVCVVGARDHDGGTPSDVAAASSNRAMAERTWAIAQSRAQGTSTPSPAHCRLSSTLRVLGEVQRLWRLRATRG